MPDLQTSMGDDILQMIVCLRDGKEAVEQLNLKAMYPEEANIERRAGVQPTWQVR